MEMLIQTKSWSDDEDFPVPFLPPCPPSSPKSPKLSYVSIASKNAVSTNNVEPERIEKYEKAVLAWTTQKQELMKIPNIMELDCSKCYLTEAPNTTKYGKQLFCKHCQKNFTFYKQELYKQLNWNEPKICTFCSQKRHEEREKVRKGY